MHSAQRGTQLQRHKQRTSTNHRWGPLTACGPAASPFGTLAPSGGKPCTCMRPSVSLQVRAFCVHFVASLKITSVDTPFPGVWRFRPSLASCALNTKRWNWTGKRKSGVKWWEVQHAALVLVACDLSLTVCSFTQTQGPMSTLAAVTFSDTFHFLILKAGGLTHFWWNTPRERKTCLKQDENKN